MKMLFIRGIWKACDLICILHYILALTFDPIISLLLNPHYLTLKIQYLLS